MELSEIRKLLLEQHAELRATIAELEAAAKAVDDGGIGAVGQLDAIVGKLAKALAIHHAAEDEHLATFLPEADAWGAERAKLLRERHDAAHVAMDACIAAVSATATALPARAQSALGLAQTLREHMRVEEKYVLSESVLRDDAILVEFGG